MNTVRGFWDKVFLNEFHHIRIKDSKTDKILCEFKDSKGFEKSGVKDKEILEFATDWENRIYILWV